MATERAYIADGGWVGLDDISYKVAPPNRLTHDLI